MNNDFEGTEKNKNTAIKVVNAIYTFKTLLVIAMLFFVFLIGTVFIFSGMPKKRYSEEVNAVVVENVKSESINRSKKNKEDNTYAPVFSYEYNGKKYRVKGNTYTNPPEYDVGDEVTIKIDPDDPEDISAPESKKIFIIGIILDAIGIGIVIFTIYRNRERKAELSEAMDLNIDMVKQAIDEAQTKQDEKNKEYLDKFMKHLQNKSNESYDSDRFYNENNYNNDERYNRDVFDSNDYYNDDEQRY